MSHSIRKQALPVEAFEQLRTDPPLLALVDRLWGCGSGIFSWLTSSSMTGSEYLRDELEQNYGVMEDFWDGTFESEDELASYCRWFEQFLEQLEADDPFLVARNVELPGWIGQQVHRLLHHELGVKFPALDAEFARRAVSGGEQLRSDSDLLYLPSEQVREVASVLNQLEMNDLFRRSDALPREPDSLEELQRTIQAFKTCFRTAAEQGQVILTKVI
jgi:hypothetical protein